MHISKNSIPTKIDVPGAIARQAINFGDASNYGLLAAEYFSLGAGTDIAPLLRVSTTMPATHRIGVS